VITQWLEQLRQSPAHWQIVVGVSVAFLLVQMYLAARQFARNRQQHRLLNRLLRDLERGGRGRVELGTWEDSFPWLDWVMGNFPDRSTGPAAKHSREEVLQELDVRVAADSRYLMLQRMGIMAPLLGVVLTVLGFTWLKIDSAGDSLQGILGAVAPLVSGVGAGAVLALINQGLLQFIGSRLERMRMAARTWFDAAIWRHVGLDVQTATVKAVAAIERFAADVGGAAARHAASANQIAATTGAMQQAGQQLAAVAHGFHGEIKDLPQTMIALRDATSASADALARIAPMHERAAANLDVSVAAFRTTIDEKFTAAAEQHHRASATLAASVAEICKTSEVLRDAAGGVQQSAATSATAIQRADQSLSAAAQGLGDASERLRRSVAGDLAPSQQSLHAAADALAQSAQQIAAFVSDGIQPATRDLAGLHQVMNGLDDTIAKINAVTLAGGDVERLAAALSRASEIAQAIENLPEQIRRIVEGSVQHAAADAAHHAATRRKPWSLRT
jgi:hypothetical protein